MYTELFRKVWKEVEKELSENPNSFLKDTAERAMNKHRVPAEERETFLYALSKKIKTEKSIERQTPEIKEKSVKEKSREGQGMFSKEIWREIKKGAREAEIGYDIEMGIHDGEISKENLKNPLYKREGKKPSDFGFGPPK